MTPGFLVFHVVAFGEESPTAALTRSTTGRDAYRFRPAPATRSPNGIADIKF